MPWIIIFGILCWWVFAQRKGGLFERLVSSVILITLIVLFLNFMNANLRFHEKGRFIRILEELEGELPAEKRENYAEVVKQFRDRKIETMSELQNRLKDLADSNTVDLPQIPSAPILEAE